MRLVTMGALVSSIAFTFVGCQGSMSVEPSASGLTEVALKLPDRSKLPADVRDKLNAYKLTVREQGFALALAPPPGSDMDSIGGSSFHESQGAYKESMTLKVSLPVGRLFHVTLAIGDASKTSGKLVADGILYRGFEDLDLIEAENGSTVSLKLKLHKTSGENSWFMPDSIDSGDVDGSVNVAIDSEIVEADDSAQPYSPNDVY